MPHVLCCASTAGEAAAQGTTLVSVSVLPTPGTPAWLSLAPLAPRHGWAWHPWHPGMAELELAWRG